MTGAMARQPHWYAVMTAPAKEVQAARGLRQRGYAVCCPMRTVRREYHGKSRGLTVRTREVLLKGYLFVRVEPLQGVYAVNETPNVSTVVYVGDQAVPISDSEIDELRAFLRKQRVSVATTPIVLYEPNQDVEFVDGPYIGEQGAVIVDSGTKIRISSPKISANPVTVTKRETLRPLDRAERVA